jgi:hypothetical protein
MGDLYLFFPTTTTSTTALTATASVASLCHCHLGHLGHAALSQLISSHAISCNKQHIIINNYIIGTHYKSCPYFSQHASIPHHNPLYVTSSSTKPFIYVFNRFYVANSIYS